MTSESALPNYKPLEYEQIPEDFNQETHYATQAEPEEYEDYIFLGVEINELELDDEEVEELP